MCADDLKHVRDLLGAPIWEHLAGARILVTGATGFIGKWLLATLIDADQVFGLGCRITAVSRNPGEFERQWPAMIGLIQWIPADVRTIPSIQQCFDIILHAATDVAGATSPQGVFSTCIDGTRRVLELAKQCGAQQLLLVSSGAVYGPLPSGMTHVPETHVGGPDPLLSSSAYAEGKRVSEWLCAQAVPDGLEVKIARVFALVGPHLPLTRHFAIGNFLQAALTNQTIVIEGDGTPYRSYLYAADMAAWLWAVLIEGTPGRAYNVGSDQSLSISDHSLSRRSLSRNLSRGRRSRERRQLLFLGYPQLWCPSRRARFESNPRCGRPICGTRGPQPQQTPGRISRRLHLRRGPRC